MKVLWITNTIFPDVCKELGIPSPVVGGWMYAGAMSLLEQNKEINLAVSTIYEGTELKVFNINNIRYYLLPDGVSKNLYNKSLEKHWKAISSDFSPDVTHIHGTEYPHGLAYLNACEGAKTVISIQGLVSIYARYYMGGIKREDLLKTITIRDIIKRDFLFNQQKGLVQRGKSEQKMIQSVSHIIGRTSWDKIHAWAIHPTIHYHFCNETLRDEFYLHEWSLTTCEKHSIFISQAHYPIKGLHQVIKALPLLIKNYPDTKVYVAGDNFVTNRGFRQNGFGKYIHRLMKKNNVEQNVVFTGVLTEKEMCQRYLKSHVFVCPSSIENSPNSVGEAQILGVPCIGSFVGGTPDMIEHEKTGLLYRFEETEMLAHLICRVFGNDKLARQLSENERKVALARHNKLTNARCLNDIYSSICKTS